MYTLTVLLTCKLAFHSNNFNGIDCIWLQECIFKAIDYFRTTTTLASWAWEINRWKYCAQNMLFTFHRAAVLQYVKQHDGMWTPNQFQIIEIEGRKTASNMVNFEKFFGRLKMIQRSWKYFGHVMKIIRQNFLRNY